MLTHGGDDPWIVCGLGLSSESAKEYSIGPAEIIKPYVAFLAILHQSGTEISVREGMIQCVIHRSLRDLK